MSIPMAEATIATPPLLAWQRLICGGYIGRMFTSMSAAGLLWVIMGYRDPQHFEQDIQFLIHTLYTSPVGPDANLASFFYSHQLFPQSYPNVVGATGQRWIIFDYAENSVPIDFRVIPQRRWIPYAGYARGIEGAGNSVILPPVFFKRLDGTIGIPLVTARSSTVFSVLQDAQTRDAMEGKSSIKLRILWAGYEPWCAQVRLRTGTRREPITLAALVRRVASRIDHYVEVAHTPLDDGADHSDWRIGNGPNEISRVNIVLVGVVAVSAGSIMPILRLR